MMLEPAQRAGDASGQDHWLRARLLKRQLHDGAPLCISALTLQLACSEIGYQQPNPTYGSPSTDCRTSCMPCSRSCGTTPAKSIRRCSTRPESARLCARPPMASPPSYAIRHHHPSRARVRNTPRRSPDVAGDTTSFPLVERIRRSWRSRAPYQSARNPDSPWHAALTPRPWPPVPQPRDQLHGEDQTCWVQRRRDAATEADVDRGEEMDHSAC